MQQDKEKRQVDGKEKTRRGEGGEGGGRGDERREGLGLQAEEEEEQARTSGVCAFVSEHVAETEQSARGQHIAEPATPFSLQAIVHHGHTFSQGEA